MDLRNGESLIQYKQGLFSRIKNTIVSLFSTDEKEDVRTANVGHDRLHEVLRQDRIRNNDIRVTKNQTESTMEEVKIESVEKLQVENIEEINKEETSIKVEKAESKSVKANEIEAVIENRIYSDDNKSTKGDIEELLSILSILNDNKIDTKKIKTYKSVNKHRKATMLKDIKQTDIDINKIIADNKLLADYPIGRKIELARRRINNIDKYRREITKEQISKLETLGIIK